MGMSPTVTLMYGVDLGESGDVEDKLGMDVEYFLDDNDHINNLDVVYDCAIESSCSNIYVGADIAHQYDWGAKSMDPDKVLLTDAQKSKIDGELQVLLSEQFPHLNVKEHAKYYLIADYG